MSLEVGSGALESAVHVRRMHADDLDSADRVMRLAFGTMRGLPDPSAAFGDSDSVHTRFRAAPECAWAAELDGEVVGSVFAARWGSFGFVGPLSIHPILWDQGIGGRLLEPVLGAFARWDLRQAGLFTFATSPKHLGLYQKYGFWPGSLTVVMTKASGAQAQSPFTLVSAEAEERRGLVLAEIRGLTDQVLRGLDLGREIVAAHEQMIGDTVLLRRERTLEGMAVCHCGAGSEAGSNTCYVKFAAVRPGENAPRQFERLLDACEAFAAESELGRVVAGVSTGRLDAYRRLLARGYRTEQVGVSMWLRPREPRFDTPAHYVIDDLR
jgi:N-acetylglutamate synthase-like GNAT family acetyltransferase